MHRVFQRDLCKLRLTTARAFVKIATDSQGPLSVSAGATVRLIARVLGMGPSFRLQLQVSNAGSRVVADLALVVTSDPDRYRIAQPLLMLPLLVPSLTYNVDTDVVCVDPTQVPDSVRVYATLGSSSVPLITAVVNMPMSEMPLDD
jgi:Bardet-Biedl syndrome 1 protein